MSYPEYAEIGGQKYKLDTDFRTGLRCFEVVYDTSIDDYERSLAVVYLLFGFVPDVELLPEFLRMAIKFLQCGETREEQTARKADMDILADEKYIMASFLSDYKIDLRTADLHWWQYIALIGGLTADCVLSNVREIRNADLSEYSDPKTRLKLERAKEQVKLPVRRTKEEQDQLDAFERLWGGDASGG